MATPFASSSGGSGKLTGQKLESIEESDTYEAKAEDAGKLVRVKQLTYLNTGQSLYVLKTSGDDITPGFFQVVENSMDEPLTMFIDDATHHVPAGESVIVSVTADGPYVVGPTESAPHRGRSGTDLSLGSDFFCADIAHHDGLTWFIDDRETNSIQAWDLEGGTTEQSFPAGGNRGDNYLGGRAKKVEGGGSTYLVVLLRYKVRVFNMDPSVGQPEVESYSYGDNQDGDPLSFRGGIATFDGGLACPMRGSDDDRLLVVDVRDGEVSIEEVLFDGVGRGDPRLSGYGRKISLASDNHGFVFDVDTRSLRQVRPPVEDLRPHVFDPYQMAPVNTCLTEEAIYFSVETGDESASLLFQYNPESLA